LDFSDWMSYRPSDETSVLVYRSRY